MAALKVKNKLAATRRPGEQDFNLMRVDQFGWKKPAAQRVEMQATPNEQMEYKIYLSNVGSIRSSMQIK